jgi:hypothetical protein
MQPKHETARWLDDPGNVTKVYRSVWIACAALVLAELLIPVHAEVSAGDWFGFHGVFGFIACVALVIAAKWMRRILIRPEDYYER